MVGNEYLENNINTETTKTNKNKVENFDNEIRISNISFKYKGGEKKIFNGFNFKIKKR